MHVLDVALFLIGIPNLEKDNTDRVNDVDKASMNSAENVQAFRRPGDGHVWGRAWESSPRQTVS